MYILKLLVILHLLIPMQIEAQRRIFEGKEVTSTKDTPFVVWLKFVTGPKVEGKGTPASTCTGIYIRPLWVLTATHCIKKVFPNADHKPLYDTTLCMGAIEPDKKCPEKDKRLANGLYPHTPGNPAYEENDVLLVSIPKPWPIGPTIQIAKLPTEKVDKKTHHNKVCIATGWGTFDTTGVDAPILKQANVKVIVGDPSKCKVEKGKRGEREICAIGQSGLTCHGDSGGPLLCEGIVIGCLRGSFGVGGACNTTTDKTSYYNLIQEYNDWIVSIAGAAPGGGTTIVPNNFCLFVIYATLYFFYILN